MSTYHKKVCHLSSVHSVTDTRIFYKECKTLVNAGYNVAFVVQNDKDEVIDGVKIISINKPKNRKERMIRTTRQVYHRALEFDADIYHFHDPELIPIGLLLKHKGKKVIYDIHEDVPRQNLTKEWIPTRLRSPLSWIVEGLENYAAKRFDYIVTATDYIANRFSPLNKCVIAVKNYPVIIEGISANMFSNRNRQICYISSHLSLGRAIVPIIESMKYIDAELIIAGKMDDSILDILQKFEGWKKTRYIGFGDKKKVHSIMNCSRVGLALFSLEPNYVNALPTKMFEYMMEGLPVVVTDIPILRKIIDKYNFGFYINSLKPEDIADRVNWLLNNPEVANEMGLRGQKAVKCEYNWSIEAEKLIDVYKQI
jgi:glycosyltransferase involved in cell wall biosynthesis